MALQFFTRVPVPRWVGFEPAWLHDSARHFPLVGLFVGRGGGRRCSRRAAVATSPVVAVVLSMIATVWLTGAFHEDGLADTCDALGGHVSRERALEIMKDSRIGSYGAVGLVLVLGLKAAVLVSLPVALALPALLLGHTVSRAMAVLVIRALPYAGDLAAAKAKPLAQGVSRGGLLVALGWVLLVAAAHRARRARPGGRPWCCRCCSRSPARGRAHGAGRVAWVASPATRWAPRSRSPRCWCCWAGSCGCGSRERCGGLAAREAEGCGGTLHRLHRRARGPAQGQAPRAPRARAGAARGRAPVVWTSPLRRGADTGRWLARWGWTHRMDARLAELDFGTWDGRSWDAVGAAAGRRVVRATSPCMRRVGANRWRR